MRPVPLTGVRDDAPWIEGLLACCEASRELPEHASRCHVRHELVSTRRDVKELKLATMGC